MAYTLYYYSIYT